VLVFNAGKVSAKGSQGKLSGCLAASQASALHDHVRAVLDAAHLSVAFCGFTFKLPEGSRWIAAILR